MINYSKKDGKFWEFSEKAVELIRDYKVLFFKSHKSPTCSTNAISCSLNFPNYSNGLTALEMVLFL